VLPPKPKKERANRGPAVPMPFRCPRDIAAWIEEQKEAGGYDRTEVIISSLRFEKDFADVLGQLVFEIHAEAEREKTSPGAIAGRLVKKALEK
jgi:hypothetical protein